MTVAQLRAAAKKDGHEASKGLINDQETVGA